MTQRPLPYNSQGQGRLVVQNTFLRVVGDSDDEDDQPFSVRRTRTDSALYGPGAARCVDYRLGSPSTMASTPWASDCEERGVADAGATGEGWRRGLKGEAAEACGGAAVGDIPRRPASGAEVCAAASSGSRPGRERTTMMLRNLPNSYSRAMLLETLDEEGFAGAYDFLYMPMDFARSCNLGYAFINLVEASVVPRFRLAFSGYSSWRVRSSKICQVTWSDRDQGLKANMRRYRNSAVMHRSVPDEYKPCLFSGGVRVPFPGPHGRLPRPQGRRT